VRGGLLTPDQLRSSVWRRLFRDVYLHHGVPVTHELRAVAAASHLFPDAVVSGRSAAVLWGIDLAGVRDDVELTVPPGRNPTRMTGVRVRRAQMDDEDVRRRLGVRVSTAEKTALRVAAILPLEEAVVAVDQMVAAGVVDLEPIRVRAAGARGRSAARVRDVCGMADGLAESPQETRLRLLIGRSTLPKPIAQYRILDADGFFARVDFAWPEQKVAVEYDGVWHAEAGQFARDRRRLNRLQAAGWRVVFVTATDLRRPEELIARIAEALTR
jgi:hypothetical protein